MTRFLLNISIFVLLSFPTSGWTTEQIVVGDFSVQPVEGILPDHWEPLLFDDIENHTTYKHVVDGTTCAIRAESSNSSSGLIRKIAINPATHPTVSFSWKIQNIIKSANLADKNTNDAPARLFISFAYNSEQVYWFERMKFEASKIVYGEYPPITTLIYVWASHLEKGTFTESPYNDRIKIIVLESGKSETGTWLSEKRDVFADYCKAFDTKTVPMISGVAIMTDTDNTAGQAVSWYGDIIFSASNPEKDPFNRKQKPDEWIEKPQIDNP